MCHVLRDLSFSNGEIAQIGDNDSARFIVVDSLPIASLRVDHYLPVADWLFELPPTAYPSDVDMSHLWWLGGTVSAPTTKWYPRLSAVFPDAGWAVVRRGDWECVVSCGPNGQRGNGGHGHNDKLGVSLAFAGSHIFVDPGSYLYTADPSARNRYRSTAFHSTPQLVGQEQNPLTPHLFSLPDASRAKILSVGEHSFSGVHQSFGDPVRLDLRATDDGVFFEYEVGPGRYIMRWLLHPAVEVQIGAGSTLLKVKSWTFRFSHSNRNTKAVEYRFSPAYGCAVRATMLTTEFESRLSCHVARIANAGMSL
jgi:hypothetical protein